METEQGNIVAVMKGLWQQYLRNEETEGNFFTTYDHKETEEDYITLGVYIIDPDQEFLDEDSWDYDPFPSTWTEGVAVLEKAATYYRVSNKVTSATQVTVDGWEIVVGGVTMSGDDTECLEFDRAVDVKTGDEVNVWA